MTVKYFADDERMIFLHFVNREACEACKIKPDHNWTSHAIECLSIAHCSGLSVNISQLLEFADNNSSFLKTILSLTHAGIITLISQAATMDAFIQSRQQLYAHDKRRYPMYFGDATSVAEQFRIGQVNTRSTTEILSRQVIDWEKDDLINPVNLALSAADRKSILPEHDLIQQLTMQETGKAVTRALYKAEYGGKRLSNSALSVVGRMVSGIYIHQYQRANGYAVCTGVPGLEYYDIFEFFLFYDIPLISHLLSLLGLRKLKRNCGKEFTSQCIEQYFSEEHRRFVGLLNVFLDSALAAVAESSRRQSGIREQVGHVGLRLAIQNFISAVFAKAPTAMPESSNLGSFYERTSTRIEELASRAREESGSFARKWSQHMEPAAPRRSALLLTATDVEDRCLAGALKAGNFVEARATLAGQVYVRTFTSAAALVVYHARSNAGSLGPGGSTLTLKDALDKLEPEFVISVGICFGTRPKEQKIGDILVSEEVKMYEPGKVAGSKFLSRGPSIPASQQLLSACRMIKEEGDRLQSGIIASGEKLVNSKDFVEKILQIEPRVIGGEMEASGISSVGQREKLDWIVVKAICDWGKRKRDDHQNDAATRSAEFAVRLLKFLSQN